MKKNGKGKPPKASGTHLIQELTGSKPVKQETKEQEKEEVIECKYGIFCAHLRAAGACSFPHRRHHYLLLNLVPPANHLEDLQEAEEEVKLSKKQRKEKKIIEKTISQHIDVEALTKQEQLNKQNAEAQIKQQFLQNMNQVERQVVDIVTVDSAQQYFAKLNEFRKEGNVFELKKRSMIHLKKKNQKVYGDIIDKEYRIANRLIKESLKNTKNSLIQIYQDINHNTIPSVRQFFEAYLQPNHGILQQDSSVKHHLSKIIHSVFFKEGSQFQSQYYMVRLKSNLSEVNSNIEFYNLMVPFLHSQSQTFNKYILLDCQEDLTLTNTSQLLTKDHALTFHAKCKPAPEYPFGQLNTNLEKFAQWASKISKKYVENNKDANIILVLNNIQKLFINPNAQQFEQEKLKERRETFRKLVKIFAPVVYFLTTSATKEEKKALSELLELEANPSTKYQASLHLLQEK